MPHKKILLAEDDELTQFMMGEMLEQLGFEYEIVGDGVECMERISRAPRDYSVVLMDINMPRMSGLKAVRNIRKFEQDPPQNLPVIAVTADMHWQNHTRCSNNGFSQVIAKPVNLDTLDSYIRTHCAA